MATFLGLLSGTSADAVDAVVVSFAAGRPRILAYLESPLPQHLRQRVLELGLGSRTPAPGELGALHVELGRAFAGAALDLLRQAGLEPSEVTALGLHGQTVAHRPDGEFPFTLQLGDPNTVAALTGIATVSDFRGMDMACGGQGAPLAPLLHGAFFRSPRVDRVIVNIGGIANLSSLPADRSQPVTGFDTGPGNSLLDAWAVRCLGEPFDRDGLWASTGSLVAPLLERLLADPYFSAPPPKSTGRDHFSLAWLEGALRASSARPREQDVQATLLALTARTIGQAVARWASDAREVYLCGGGASNPALRRALAEELGERRLESTEALGLHPGQVEAVLFAWLARERVAGRAVDLTAVTGARRAAVLGALYAPPPA